MRRYAITVAVAGFFLLSTVAYLCDVPVFVCAIRGLVGAIALYVMTRLAGGMVLQIMVDTMIRHRSTGETTSERRSK